jgi:hypothetical protein
LVQPSSASIIAVFEAFEPFASPQHRLSYYYYTLDSPFNTFSTQPHFHQVEWSLADAVVHDKKGNPLLSTSNQTITYKKKKEKRKRKSSAKQQHLKRLSRTGLNCQPSDVLCINSRTLRQLSHGRII